MAAKKRKAAPPAEKPTKAVPLDGESMLHDLRMDVESLSKRTTMRRPEGIDGVIPWGELMTDVEYVIAAFQRLDAHLKARGDLPHDWKGAIAPRNKKLFEE